jgi:hypothetical protein
MGGVGRRLAPYWVTYVALLRQAATVRTAA